MTLSTLGVGAAVSPAIAKAWLSHFTNRKDKHGRPTAHISYSVGLALVRQFLTTASHGTVEELQAFTQQYVPTPSWVRIEEVDIPTKFIHSAIDRIVEQLGSDGIEQVGGSLWWQWRRTGEDLRAEWIEMKKDHSLRKQRKEECRRAMMYIHGGAYYFGSVDEHRYQIQRHARKLQARAIAPRYRLSPQYPFPCGLLDCLATYLYLLEQQPPETIILAGDSAGGGMVLSLLTICRDQGIPLPAGAVLISPWVDLTHSFPSLSESPDLDYVPASGFHHKPSACWPPPNSDELQAMEELMVPGPEGQRVKRKDHQAQLLKVAKESRSREAKKQQEQTAEVGASVQPQTEPIDDEEAEVMATPGLGDNLSVVIDGNVVELKDQIQMYAPNHLLAHPLVSPALQPSLGGLCPLLVMVGGGELLRDEQIYIAHKAANPRAYPPPARTPGAEKIIEEALAKYPPTQVQLQVWDDLCHVAPTLSFSRPAKYMYRSIAQFGAWALARAQKREIRILADDDISDIESESDDEDMAKSEATKEEKPKRISQVNPHQSPSLVSLTQNIGKAGDPIPPFHKNMIRQRVNRHGQIFPLPPAAKLPALQMEPSEIGAIKAGPVSKWLERSKWYADKFGKEKRKVQDKRIKQIESGGIAAFIDEGVDLISNVLEKPPPTALAGFRHEDLPPKRVKKASTGLAMWAKAGWKHDENAIDKEKEKIEKKEKVSVSVTAVRPAGATAAGDQPAGSRVGTSSGAPQIDFTPDDHRIVTGFEAGPAADRSSSVDPALTALPQSSKGPTSASHMFTNSVSQLAATNGTAAPVEKTVSGHPAVAADGAVSPFKVADEKPNPSTATLQSHPGVITAGQGAADGGDMTPGVDLDDDEEPVVETAQARRVSVPMTSATNTITTTGQSIISKIPIIGAALVGGTEAEKTEEAAAEKKEEPTAPVVAKSEESTEKSTEPVVATATSTEAPAIETTKAVEPVEDKASIPAVAAIDHAAPEKKAPAVVQASTEAVAAPDVETVVSVVTEVDAAEASATAQGAGDMFGGGDFLTPEQAAHAVQNDDEK